MNLMVLDPVQELRKMGESTFPLPLPLDLILFCSCFRLRFSRSINAINRDIWAVSIAIHGIQILLAGMLALSRDRKFGFTSWLREKILQKIE